MDLDTVKQMINTAAVFCDTNVTQIAKAIGMAPSVLYKKISRNTLKPHDLYKIAESLGAEYHFYFLFPNGSKIGNLENSKFLLKGKKTNKS